MTTRIRRWRSDAGSELIEFAIVLPIFLLVVAALVDFGFLFQRYEVVTNAAREGARVAVLPGYATADVQARVQAYLTAGGLTATPTIARTTGSQTIGVYTVGTVTVTVTYPSQYSFIGPFASMFGGSGWSSINLVARSTMRVEG